MPGWDPVEVLADLVAIPSVNPMGRDLHGPEFLEQRLSDHLQGRLESLGVPWERVEIAAGRANLIAVSEGARPSSTILLDAHQDTVPVDGMVIPPFTPVQRDGRMYGRGTCDVKGGMAAMLCAFERLVRERTATSPRVILSLTCDEESTSLGINHLAAHLTQQNGGYRLLNHRPDVAIVAEPTLLHVVVAHRGTVRWRMHTAGRACHSSRPQDGVNAIYRMQRVLDVLERYAAEVPGLRPPHPLCGPATLSVGLIWGGSSVNVVPDRCSIEIDRRVIPGEDSLAAYEGVRARLAGELDFPVEFDAPYCDSPPLGDELNGQLGERLVAITSRIAGPRERIGVPYGTHASRLARAGVPTVVCGPGDIAQAHTKDEWIALDELPRAVDAYVEFCQTH
jgi:succinyl-diaminopimelate desuccinylase